MPKRKQTLMLRIDGLRVEYVAFNRYGDAATYSFQLRPKPNEKPGLVGRLAPRAIQEVEVEDHLGKRWAKWRVKVRSVRWMDRPDDDTCGVDFEVVEILDSPETRKAARIEKQDRQNVAPLPKRRQFTGVTS